MFPAFGVGAGVTRGAEHNRYALVLIKNSARKVAGDDGVIVGMSDHEQDVGFVTFVRGGDLSEGGRGEQAEQNDTGFLREFHPALSLDSFAPAGLSLLAP